MGDSPRRYDRYDRDERRRDRSRSRSPARRSSSYHRESRGRSHDHNDHAHYKSHRRSSSPRHHVWRDARRRELYVFKPVPLDQYRTEYKAGKYAHLKLYDKLAMFGSGTMPIFVPLAAGESERQYETRFCAWLARENRTLAQLRSHSDIYTERMFRIEFANANVVGFERFEAFDWSSHTTLAELPQLHHRTQDGRTHTGDDADQRDRRDATRRSSRDELSTPRDNVETAPSADDGASKSERRHDGRTPVKARELDEKPATVDTIVPTPTTDAGASCPCQHMEQQDTLPTAAVVDAHLACGCTPCLFAVMNLTAQQLGAIETAAATTASARSEGCVVDLIEE